ncbi:mini-chromosome maintenance complex-binding protein [Strongylocentrotus purpuratus]|uniref:Mini-chromosome maintenance complex-binding protein n=1 Tax=Strongylocentrotus purpuratus TaxID=7668 RepID=A0A7M7HES2_STRPU|nr:mini-chromosome maintenance complex-binding protein [Strongylocentrotus purpuratus]|eukprot:XP_011662249.1 PREDICTED: mini-chromosome maintenance complex-binding protein [Strongylocentrotus purpuratus]
MPGIDDWVNLPLDIVQSLFDAKNKEWSNNVDGFFKNRLSDFTAWQRIPSLNHTPLHTLKPNSLVRFRCMVQDMFDPEFYLGVYEVQNKSSNSTFLKTGKYQDVAECSRDQLINLESRQNVTWDRQTLYCVPIPAENEWIKQGYAETSQQMTCPPLDPSSSSTSRVKRALDIDESSPSASQDSSVTPHQNGGEVAMENGGDAEKRSRTTDGDEGTAGGGANTTVDLNFPIPGEKGTACLVKVYDQIDVFRVAEMVEFVGVLSVDPSLAHFADSEQESGLGDAVESMECIEEQNAHSPPPSLVPRLHVIASRKLSHNNPHIPDDINSIMGKSLVENTLKEAGVIRDQLRWLLSQVLLCDALTADYLILHLLSSVYARREVCALGKLSLNLTGIPQDPEFVATLYALIEQLVSKSHLLPLTLSNMNKLKLTPKKDYTANRLKSGLLQLTDRTHLVLDETALQPGQLDANGVMNLAALGNIISWQKVDYDFNYHKTEFHTNVGVLVLSDAKSILPTDCRVHLQPKRDQVNMTEVKASVQEALKSGTINLDKIRTFLEVLPLLEYTMSEDVQKFVEEDFVEARKGDPNKMTPEDFQHLLVITRLLSLSLGQPSLTRQIWERAKRMEAERKNRLQSATLPASSAATAAQ